MSKIIVQNDSSVDDGTALLLVAGVVRRGRVSDGGQSYCYLTVTDTLNRRVQIGAFRNKASDRFVLVDDPNQE